MVDDYYYGSVGSSLKIIVEPASWPCCYQNSRTILAENGEQNPPGSPPKQWINKSNQLETARPQAVKCWDWFTPASRFNIAARSGSLSILLKHLKLSKHLCKTNSMYFSNCWFAKTINRFLPGNCFPFVFLQDGPPRLETPDATVPVSEVHSWIHGYRV